MSIKIQCVVELDKTHFRIEVPAKGRLFGRQQSIYISGGQVARPRTNLRAAKPGTTSESTYSATSIRKENDPQDGKTGLTAKKSQNAAEGSAKRGIDLQWCAHSMISSQTRHIQPSTNDGLSRRFTRFSKGDHDKPRPPASVSSHKKGSRSWLTRNTEIR